MPSPLVSFIVVADPADTAAEATLRSCLAQSLLNIEVVLVLADRPAPIDRDTRVHIVAQSAGTPLAEMRRSGLEAATAPVVLVVSAGDEVSRDVAERLHQLAETTGPDIFGFTVVEHDDSGRAVHVEEPPRGLLHDVDIARRLAPRETNNTLALTRTAFRTQLLREVYATVPDVLVDDRGMVLLAYAAAKTYASIDSAEYRRPRPKAVEASTAQFHRCLERLVALRAIQPQLRARARTSANPEPMLEAYQSGYLTLMAEALSRFASLSSEQREAEQGWLRESKIELDAIRAAATLAPDLLPVVIAHGSRRELGGSPVRSVLLTTNVLTTGGVSGVLLTQARILRDAGYRVTIATHRAGSAEDLVPEGVALEQLMGTSRGQRVSQWAKLCRRHEVDIVIDHRILYSRDWPAFALAARAVGAATIGWIHNFAGRPTYNGNDLQSLLTTHLGALAHLIVLSPLDVAFWKLRGVQNVSYLPNPPSPFLLKLGDSTSGRKAPIGRRVELVWWGRLEEHTKKVTQLVDVAAALEKLGVDFRLRIIGPDWADMSVDRLHALAARRGVTDRVIATGPLHGDDLLSAIDSSDVFVSTSIIEGYPLTLPEAQSRGLPVAMYELPWLALVQDNRGVISTPQLDPEALAVAIADLVDDAECYEAMSRASLAAAARACSHDFSLLYERMMRGDLPPAQSPEPTLDDGRRVLELLVFFAEHSAPPPRATAAKGSVRTNHPRRRRPRTFGERIERKLTPLGNRMIDAAPWLRPVAGNIKSLLLRRR